MYSQYFLARPFDVGDAKGVTRQFGRDKTTILVDRFYQPSIKHNITRIAFHYRVCQVAKCRK